MPPETPQQTAAPHPPAPIPAAKVTSAPSDEGTLPAPADDAGQSAQPSDLDAQYEAMYLVNGVIPVGRARYYADLKGTHQKNSEEHKERNPFKVAGRAIKNFFADGDDAPAAQQRTRTVAETPYAKNYKEITPEISVTTAPASPTVMGSSEALAFLDAHRTGNTDLAHLDQARFAPALAGLGEALEQRGFHVEFHSLYRSPEKQLETIRENTRYDVKTGREYLIRPTASEFGSEHSVGCAADSHCAGSEKFPPGYLAALKELAPQFGLTTVANDPGHVQLNDPAYVNQLRQQKFGGVRNAVYEKPKANPLHTALNTI